MEDQTQKWKPQGGFWLWLLVTLGFFAVDILGTQFLRDATAILLIDSLVRIVFGVLSVWLLVKYFDKGSWRNVIHGKNLGAALLAGGGVRAFLRREEEDLLLRMARPRRAQGCPDPGRDDPLREPGVGGHHRQRQDLILMSS